MAKKTVQDLILQKLDSLDSKLDVIATKTIPQILVDVAINNQQIKDEAKNTSRVHSMIWGGLTLAVALTGVAVAYFK